MSRWDDPVFQVSEAQFQRAVIEIANYLGWTSYHTFDSRHSAKGFPDIVAVHPEHGIVWLELKRMTGKVRREQQEWIDLLTMVGQRAYIVRPNDMDFLESLFRGDPADERLTA